jgi:prephenate dehydratase
VRGGRADAAVLPIENAIVGDIIGALEAIDVHAVGLDLADTVDVPVLHCILGVPGATLEMVERVRSHPVALAQCAHWLRAHDLIAEPTEDTAGAARQVVERGDLRVAAIAGAAAAQQYGLVVLARDVADARDNWTRFVRLTRGW